ncbi:biosynthetic peptidoglycan transglycosylase [Maribacter litopenaei]|uniref:biosynthetic peptidoglycan transglycosylase n=1 Tax=Maribacter litopenaei TaxID=2976127 RepID=UPI003084051A
MISIEDERFYEHSGVDYPSLLRVGLKTILMGDESSGGGSTISQQLAKNLYPVKDRKPTNIVIDKIKEMFIAGRLEDIYDKNQILTHYLNTVSFGDNTFGIESASLKFFNTRTKDLSVEEAATLVGMLKATYGYNPRIFPKRVRQEEIRCCILWRIMDSYPQPNPTHFKNPSSILIIGIMIIVRDSPHILGRKCVSNYWNGQKNKMSRARHTIFILRASRFTLP